MSRRRLASVRASASTLPRRVLAVGDNADEPTSNNTSALTVTLVPSAVVLRSLVVGGAVGGVLEVGACVLGDELRPVATLELSSSPPPDSATIATITRT